MLRARKLEYRNGFIPERSPIFSSTVSLERTVSGSKVSREAGGVGGKFASPIFSRQGFVYEEYRGKNENLKEVRKLFDPKYLLVIISGRRLDSESRPDDR
jgi:hypothetical protein